MGFYISYKDKGGNIVNENFGSWYLMICRKKQLAEQGIQAELCEKRCFFTKQAEGHNPASKEERSLANKLRKADPVTDPKWKAKPKKASKTKRVSTRRTSNGNKQ